MSTRNAIKDAKNDVEKFVEDIDPSKNGNKKLYLDQVINSISNAFVYSKTAIDKTAADNRSLYDNHELLKYLPMNTFDISTADITIRFIIDQIEESQDSSIGQRVSVIMNSEKLSSNASIVSEIKFTIDQNSYARHKVGDDVVYKASN